MFIFESCENKSMRKKKMKNNNMKGKLFNSVERTRREKMGQSFSLLQQHSLFPYSFLFSRIFNKNENKSRRVLKTQLTVLNFEKSCQLQSLCSIFFTEKANLFYLKIQYLNQNQKQADRTLRYLQCQIKKFLEININTFIKQMLSI